MKQDKGDTVSLSLYDLERVEHIRSFIITHLHEDLAINKIAASFSMSARTLRRHFISRYGISIHQFIQHSRVTKSLDLIQNSSLSLKEIAAAVGYERYTSFHHAFLKHCGTSPRSLRLPPELALKK